MCDKKWDEDSELIRISEAALGRGSAWATSIHPPPPTGGGRWCGRWQAKAVAQNATKGAGGQPQEGAA